MSAQHQLLQLFKHIDEETAHLEDVTKDVSVQKAGGSYNHDVFIASLELDKLNINMDRARSILLDIESAASPGESPSASTASLLRTANASSKTSMLRGHLKSLNDRLQRIGQTVRAVQVGEARAYDDEQTKLHHRRTSSLTAASLKEKSVDDAQGHSSSMDQKLSVQRNTQETLSSEILDMVSTMKNNALRFADKIAQDNNVIQSTSDALHKSSGSMNKVGSRLSSWQKSSALGYKFYILSALFLFLALVLGMTFVRLFPKW
ncbi:hypothetical protein TRICI_006493 [Trichomonascus ciferrii]|uniref:Uncharacterized protein n=1 Tax=Trichomonascus ciferrii TaxID=44093 RepID=A0A642UGU6_9ASCO|nr:hypothetical protein TRICI_006493 [Trichomonascus ciferrii]